MNASHLNEHDANQGAQSSGEFLGMTGNTGWYLFGSGGMTVLMVILLWGMLGLSLLMCLLIGVVLCTLSLAYVFALKNNRPEHYDTDFFESALIEAGVLELQFGPRTQRLMNPFTGMASPGTAAPARPFARLPFKAAPRKIRSLGTPAPAAETATSEPTATEKPKVSAKKEPVVTQAAYEELQDRLHAAEERLEEAFIERLED
ncbi:hypothetical protein OPIT5_06215 [Opitutaceae bacterium TAV5]|nr:hypothetical protein OPIT5_06215 [Opitutaceae bacterium TAV5]